MEDFTDGDFATNPKWTGDEADFLVVDGKLKSNGPEETSVLYLSTPSKAIEEASWSFLVELGFAPSSSNQVRVYLVSDNADLEAELQGYFVEIGQSGADQIKLYRQDGASSVLLFTGATAFSDQLSVRVKVTRDREGLWSVMADANGGNALVSEGDSFVDETYTSSAFFGVVCKHSRTRNDLFFFDDFVVTGTEVSDDTPPVLTAVRALSDAEVQMEFSESLDVLSAEIPGNYDIDQGISILEATLTEANTVKLTTSKLTNGTSYLLQVNNVEDESGNAVELNSARRFTYLVTSPPEFREVVINEIFSNQMDDQTITNDFIELYNATADKFFDLENWTLEDNNMQPDAFGGYILRPGAYVIVSSDTSQFSTDTDKIQVSIDNFNNQNDHVVLRNSNQGLIDSVGYMRTDDGISIEQINPTIPFFLQSNYGNSTSPEGVTPGKQNSIFNDEPDLTPPQLMDFQLIDSTLVLVFNEPIKATTAEQLSNFTVTTGIVFSASLNDDETVLSLTCSNLVPNRPNELTIQNIEDLFGNTMSTETLVFLYYQTEKVLPGDIVINEFLANPIEDNDDFVELYNRSEKFLSVEGWTISDKSSSSTLQASFVLEPDAYLVIHGENSTTDYSSYGSVISVPRLTLNNNDDLIALSDSVGEEITYLSYGTITEEGRSLELINPDHQCISFSSYDYSLDPAGFTPGKRNSNFDSTPDTRPPTISSYGYDDALMINFSEVMDPASLINPANYQNDALTVDSIIVPSEFPLEVTVKFEEEIVLGKLYDVVISGVADCSGNTIEPTSVSFAFGRNPTFNELIITEVFFDPEPAVGLPEREYLEVLNTSEDIVTTAGLTLSDATSTVAFPVVNLLPGAYYTVTSVAAASEFTGGSINLSSFPSLSNSGELLILSLEENPIYSVAYDPSWHDAEKLDGGYSLEMVDVTNPCLQSPANWRSSEDSRGGTPGEPNSVEEVIPDNFGPEVVKITAIASDTIKFDFHEKVDISTIHLARLVFDPILEVKELYVDAKAPSSFWVVLEEGLAPNLPYAVDVAAVFDCSGNEVRSTDLTVVLPLFAQPGEIKLSEVLFNPRSNGVDFVEIFNDSDNYISLKDWYMARLTSDGVSDLGIISEDEFVMNPRSYLAFTEDADVLLANYPKGELSQIVEITSLPSYANDTGTVMLLNPFDEVMERFHYDQAYHYRLLESVDGVSLERISFSNPSNLPSNWSSASSTVGFATPGYTNSQSRIVELAKSTIQIDPKAFVPGDAGFGRNFTTINYQFESPGQFGNVNIYDQNGRLIRNLAQGELLARTGFLRWDGESNAGSMARLGYYVVLFEVYDQNGYSEVFKNTVVVGRDF